MHEPVVVLLIKGCITSETDSTLQSAAGVEEHCLPALTGPDTLRSQAGKHLGEKLQQVSCLLDPDLICMSYLCIKYEHQLVRRAYPVVIYTASTLVSACTFDTLGALQMVYVLGKQPGGLCILLSQYAKAV